MSEEDFNLFLIAINQLKVWEMEERLNIIDNEVLNGKIGEAREILANYVKGELK